MTKSELIESLLADLDAIAVQCVALKSLSPERLNYKRSPESWSALECFEHLNRYNQYYLPEICKALSVAAPASQEVGFTWLGKLSIKSISPENVKKAKTFARMNPGGSALPAEVSEQFISSVGQLRQLIEGFKKADVNAKVVRVEFARFMKMRAGESLVFVIRHIQRHLLQARRAAHAMTA